MELELRNLFGVSVYSYVQVSLETLPFFHERYYHLKQIARETGKLVLQFENCLRVATSKPWGRHPRGYFPGLASSSAGGATFQLNRRFKIFLLFTLQLWNKMLTNPFVL